MSCGNYWIPISTPLGFCCSLYVPRIASLVCRVLGLLHPRLTVCAVTVVTRVLLCVLLVLLLPLVVVVRVAEFRPQCPPNRL